MRFHRVWGLGVLVAALSQAAVAAVSLNLPNLTAAPDSSFTFDVVFTVSPAQTLPSQGYNVALSISGPDDKLSITDATAMGLYGTKGNVTFVPADSVDVGVPQVDLYAFTGLTTSGTAPVTNGCVFATFTAHLAAGASGVYHLNWYTIDDGVYPSQIYDGTGGVMAVAFGNGSVAVPEPVFVSLAGVVSGGLLLRKRAAMDL